MTGLCSLVLFALQSTTGLPPGTEVDAQYRFGVEGEYRPHAQTLAAEGGHTYVISSAMASGMRSWTRSKLDGSGAVLWSHTDYQAAYGTTSTLVGDLLSDAQVAASFGLLISAQVDGRGPGVYRLLAHSTADGSEVWAFEPTIGATGFEIAPNAQARTILDEPRGLIYQVLLVSGEVIVRQLDLQSGALLSTKTHLAEFDNASIFDAELSQDGQRLYLAGTVTTSDIFTTITHGIALALDTSNGAELWRTLDSERWIYEVDEKPGATQVALMGAIFDGSNRLWAADGLTGTEAWSTVVPGASKGPAELEYTADGTGLIAASGQPFLLFPTVQWQPGGALERFDSSDGSLVWQRSVTPQIVSTSFGVEPIEMAVHSGGTVLWSYTSGFDSVFDPVETVTLEGIDAADGSVLFDEVVHGRNYGRVQAVEGTGEFALLHTDPIDPLSDELREPTARRLLAADGSSTLSHQPDRTGPVRSSTLNFEATEDASRAAMLRLVEDLEPRLELVWIDLTTGQELWSDVLPATDGLILTGHVHDRNREMLLSPDESVLITLVRGDGGKAYKARMRAYAAESGQLLWTDSWDKQKGASLFNQSMTRPGNRSLEVTDDEVILAGNISANGGMLLASRDLWTGAENWTLLSESGTTNYAYSTHVAVDGDDVYSILEAPVGALAAPGRRIVRVDRSTGAILSFHEVDTFGFITRLFAKGGGDPVLVSDNTVTGSYQANTRLIAPDLSGELALFSGDYGGALLAPGEGYLVSGEFQVADTPAAGELELDVNLLAVLDPAPGGAPSSLKLLDRGQLAFSVIDQDPLSGEPANYVRFWDATDGAFMWSGPLFGGTDWDVDDVEHLEQLPGRAGFVGLEGSTTAELPSPDESALSPVVQILDLPELIVEPTEVSLSGGAQLDYWLRRNADSSVPQAYFLVGGLDEVNDGPVIDGIQMPFAATDAYTLLTLLQANQANFVDTLGVLDEFGNARARINSPAGLDPALVGETFHYAWLTIDLAPFALITDVSHTVQTLKLP